MIITINILYFIIGCALLGLICFLFEIGWQTYIDHKDMKRGNHKCRVDNFTRYFYRNRLIPKSLKKLISNKLSQLTKQRLKKGYAFNPKQLVYSAYSRCKCGYGLAYPKHINVTASCWYCSGLLRGINLEEFEHTDPLPFVFYDIKGEKQPSANGHNTRELLRNDGV